MVVIIPADTGFLQIDKLIGQASARAGAGEITASASGAHFMLSDCEQGVVGH